MASLLRLKQLSAVSPGSQPPTYNKTRQGSNIRYVPQVWRGRTLYRQGVHSIHPVTAFVLREITPVQKPHGFACCVHHAVVVEISKADRADRTANINFWGEGDITPSIAYCSPPFCLYVYVA